MASFFVEAGRMALGSRLRRLTDRVTEDAARVFAGYDVALEPRWFPVFFVLARQPGVSTTDIAEAIGHSRPSVSQILAEMKRHGLVETRPSPSDRRATINALTPAGQALSAPLADQCADVAEAMEDLAAETEHDIWLAIGELERALDRRALLDRALDQRARRKAAQVTIRPFRSGDEEAFKSLNLEWIERYFTLEPKDEEALDDPQSTILDRGGRILMAQQAGATVGTCALAVLDERTVELAKMAAAPAARGRGVGFALGRAAITAAREMGAHRIYLETNSRLSAAVTLYRRLGFRPANGPPSPYERCDTQMELALI